MTEAIASGPDPVPPLSSGDRGRSRVTTVLLVLVLVLPLAAWAIVPVLPARSSGLLETGSVITGTDDPGWELETVIEGRRSWITNVQVVDLDDDGVSEILACDAGENRLAVCRRNERGWAVETLANDLLAPAHATLVDLDGDADRDLVVSLLGNIQPDDGVVGQVVWLERVEEGYRRHVVLDGVRRVADARAGDLDGDGDQDLVVAVFGYARGEVLWLENDGKQSFTSHRLLSAPGAIHVPLADFDGDGDLDIVTVVSQDEEEVWGFENLGAGRGPARFRSRRLWFTHNHDLGSAGLVPTDFDGDGDLDLLLPTGDNFEYRYTYPQPYHGCLLIRNDGDWTWAVEPLADLGGTYAAAVGEMGIVLVSMFNAWHRHDAASVLLVSPGSGNRRLARVISTRPSHLSTVDCGDLDGDGRDDIVVGSLHVSPPFDRAAALSVFINRTKHRDSNSVRKSER
tara:strand:- start:5771 stop:7138 length:1368 start_codon:yes stop_codon:yes gene_type:complete